MLCGAGSVERNPFEFGGGSVERNPFKYGATLIGANAKCFRMEIEYRNLDTLQPKVPLLLSAHALATTS